MAATELQKKAIYTVVFVGLTVLIMSALLFFEGWLQTSILPQFGMNFQTGWELTAESSQMAMNSAYANAFDAFFRIVKIVLWLALVITVVRFAAFVILRVVYRNSQQTEVSSLLKTVFSIIIYITAFFIIFQTQYPGVSLTPLFTGSTILGIVVGLALQDTLGNLFAGLALQADQSFQVGDVVSITNRGSGVVEKVSWRGVKIRTFQNKLLVISNAVLGKEMIEVAPRDNLNARVVFFSTLYNVSPATTAHLVREAMRHAENVSPKKRPNVRIRGLGDYGIEWEVKYWLENYENYNDTDALIRERIWYAFQREKMEFPSPTRTIHIAEKHPEIAVEEKVIKRTESLNRVPIFDPLSEEEMTKLAEATKGRIYAPGEAIVRAGQEGNSMFVIIRGSVNVDITENNVKKTVNSLHQNDFFGEMSLLTGEPRSATVIATEETEVLQIKKNALKPILEGNPLLVETICEIIEDRKEGLNAQMKIPVEEAETRRKGMFGSIRKFFGLR